MDIFIKVFFWIGVVVTIIRLIEMATCHWPRELEPETLGFHAAKTILGLAIVLWAGLLLWG